SGLSSPREEADEVVMKATIQRRIDRMGIGKAPGSRSVGVRSGIGTGEDGVEVEDLEGLGLPFQHPTGRQPPAREPVGDPEPGLAAEVDAAGLAVALQAGGDVD